MMTSSRSSSERVAEWRMRSICSLIERFLLDEGVGARDVGLGLVVVVVGDEILDRVVREEFLELGIELRGQRLVGREDQGRALRLLDHLGHGEGLARAGDAEQHLGAVGFVDALDEILIAVGWSPAGSKSRHHLDARCRLRTFPGGQGGAAPTARRSCAADCRSRSARTAPRRWR